jgi:hypothetical protein
MKTLFTFLFALLSVSSQAQFYRFNRWTTNIDTTSINGATLTNIPGSGLQSPLVVTTVNVGTLTVTNPIVFRGDLGTDDTANGLAISGLNAGATIAQWEAVYVGASSTWLLADANGSGTFPARGLATAAYVNGNAAVILVTGTVRNDAWNWTPGGMIFLSETAGALTQTAPASTVQPVGFALTADIAYFKFDPTNVVAGGSQTPVLQDINYGAFGATNISKVVGTNGYGSFGTNANGGAGASGSVTATNFVDVINANGRTTIGGGSVTTTGTGANGMDALIVTNDLNVFGGVVQRNLSTTTNISPQNTFGGTTPAAVGVLTVTNLAAGQEYAFTAIVFATNQTASDGIKVDFNGGSATMTTFRATVRIYDTALLTCGQVFDLDTDTTAATITGQTLVEVNGFCKVNAAGTFIPRFSKNSGSGQFDILRGSHILFTQLR